MFSYESGLIFAFMIWAWTTINALIIINSRMEKNLNRIGQRISWLTLKPQPTDPDELCRPPLRKCIKFIVIYGAGLPLIFGSWLYVAIVAAMVTHRIMNDAGAPQAIREFRWKLKNLDMSFDQLIHEWAKASEQDPATFEQAKSEMIENLRGRGFQIPKGNC